MPKDTPQPQFTASELADRAGVTERTVRFYVSEALLPPPAGRGRGAHFGAGHLVRLKLIRALQQAGNELETIREYLQELGPDDAKAEGALRVWESRQERAQWADSWREKLGTPAAIYRYRIAEGVELLVDTQAALSRARMASIMRTIREAFASEE
jgi:DNA-binding transcriptional MerR regulator